MATAEGFTLDDLVQANPTVAEVLELVKQGGIEPAVAAEYITRKSNGNGNGKLSCKVSEKKALSVYGLQRMPVTLYVGQWERLFEFISEMKEFIGKHTELARK